MRSSSPPSIPTRVRQRVVALPQHLRLRMYARIAASRCRTKRIDLGIARGEQVGEVLERDPQMVDRAEDVVGVGLVAVALERVTIGESGGTYQTIGIVRYSGCSGSATL